MHQLSEEDRFIRDTARAFQLTEDQVKAELKQNPKMMEDGIFLLQADYNRRGRVDAKARDLLCDAACSAGFQDIDICESRAAFSAEPGRWAEFEEAVRAAARRRGVRVKRLLYIADPGMGLFLRFTEDGQYDALPRMDPAEQARLSAELTRLGFQPT